MSPIDHGQVPPSQHRGYFICWRTDDASELLRSRPNAFRLLFLIASRVRYRPGYNAEGLAQGECCLGAEDVGRALNLSPREYRTAKGVLESAGFATFTWTGRGTVARLCDSRVFSAFIPDSDRPNDRPNARPATDQRQTSDRPPTTNNKVEGENVEEGEETKREGDGNLVSDEGPGERPKDLDECLAMAIRIAMPEQDARDWYRDSEAALWTRGDGTRFDNWVRQMIIHRDKDKGQPRVQAGHSTTKPNGARFVKLDRELQELRAQHNAISEQRGESAMGKRRFTEEEKAERKQLRTKAREIARQMGQPDPFPDFDKAKPSP